MSMRRVLVTMLCLSAGLAPEAQGPQAPYVLKEIATNVWAAIDNEASPASSWSNAGFVVGPNGVAVIDTLGNANAARALLADIRRTTTRPIVSVVDTHYHLDHVAGNAIFANAGATVWAQRKVRCWIRAENAHLIGPDAPAELKAVVAALEPPARVYDTARDQPLGPTNIRWRSMPGHTGGDTVVIVPSAKVVFMGDLLWRQLLPTLVDATTRTWVRTLETLLKAYPDYTFVPGHGDVATAADVADFRDYLVALRTSVAAGRARHAQGAALADAVVPELQQRFGRWPFIDAVARDNVRDVNAELGGSKRIPRMLPGRAGCDAPY
jgi:glyoxylase-like metal-dependent hydrolase (beta-lactamase superfamily II)